MKNFLLKLSVFLALFCASCYAVFSLADGSADAFYVKFTTPKQKALIIGSSRAAQGLQPAVINSVLETTNIYNYAFSRVHTPYGPAYFNSIKNKLAPNSKEGIFLICVNPWTISTVKKRSLGETTPFEENLSFSSKLKSVNSNPNIPYLINFYNDRNIEIILKRFSQLEKKTLFVHDNGWLEATRDNNKNKVNVLTKATINSYYAIKEDYEGFSESRLFYLEKCVEYLKNHGYVYLIRLPISKEMQNIEQELMPDFDDKMEKISIDRNVPYINGVLFSETYEYTDGHHLRIDSGKAFSLYIAQEIKKHKFVKTQH